MWETSCVFSAVKHTHNSADLTRNLRPRDPTIRGASNRSPEFGRKVVAIAKFATVNMATVEVLAVILEQHPRVHRTVTHAPAS